MAITNCPECNGKISTTVDQCIHCGCKLAHCPECGITVIQGVQACPECGAAIEAPATPVAQAEAPAKENIASLFNKWKQLNPVLAYFGTTDAGVLGCLFIVLCVPVGVICAISGSHFLLVVYFLLGYVIEIIQSLSVKSSAKSFWNWCAANNFNLPDLIDATFALDFLTMDSSLRKLYKKGIMLGLSAHYNQIAPSAVSSRTTLNIIRCIIGAIAAVLGVAFLSINNFLRDWDFSNIRGLPCLAIFLILCGINWFVVSKKIKKTEKEETEWQRETYKEGYANYSANLSDEL